MSTKPIIAVTGATGAQGGSVVKFLLKDGGFQIRALTRNVDSDAAKDWDPAVFNEEKEVVQGKLLVDAAKSAGVKHFVYSTLEEWNTPKVEHFNAKFRINNYLIESGVPRTSIYTDFYFENFSNPAMDVFAIKKHPSQPGSFVAEWPTLWSDGPIPGYAVADTGAYVLAAFKDPSRFVAQDIKILTDLFAAELHGNMESFYKTNGTLNREPHKIEEAKQIYPEAITLREFVKANIGKLLPQ
ncbi:NAD(P)-binding protein [Schizopora paradoxa]|uniref:NAD(P)-binding protein n=1 Tax=Schizopora paradoxa TaxID=27342 RepID=A0A0H2R5F7_9AGAM|nr:NAD(P)-binding protein [Schizopora paradoxa]